MRSNENQQDTRTDEEKAIARAEFLQEMTERALQAIEALPTDKQQAVLECGMRMRELAAYYGPYFRYALALTSCEIASGALLLPKQGEFERTDIMLPGLKQREDLGKIIVGEFKKG